MDELNNPSDNSTLQSKAYRLRFRLAQVFPVDKPLSVPLLRLMTASNDVRHIQKLMLAKDERIGQDNEFENAVLNGEILHLERLLCGHLYEAGIAFRNIDMANPELANTAVQGTEYEPALHHLREIYASDPPGAFHRSFLFEVRNQFGFHYKDDAIRLKLEEFIRRGTPEGEAIHAELSGLSRYVIADNISIGILQDILNVELPDLHDTFERAMDKALGLARDLSDIVDLMLLPLLEQHESVILKRETGTLSVQCAYVPASPMVDAPSVTSATAEIDERKENNS